MSYARYQAVALAKEIESPENPGGLEKRVALIPEDVDRLIKSGISVYVEQGAGEGVGFSDAEYLAVGAQIQNADEIYKDKDLIIKFKGPSMASIEHMRYGCTLFCMAHFHSYPDRAELLERSGINVIAMEEVLVSPKVESDQQILSRTAMAKALAPFLDNNSIGSLRVRIIGWSERLSGSIHRAGNRDPRSLQVLPSDVTFEELHAQGSNSLYFYDSKYFEDTNDILHRLKTGGAHLFDLYEFERSQADKAIYDFRESHPPLEFGLRRIQCLHETGMAGARYGLKLHQQNRPGVALQDIRALVLGYGNVGMGAIHELFDQGLRSIQILGRTHTAHGRIEYWLKNTDLIVNGAEQAPHLRGVNFLITNDHLKMHLAEGSVVIDLVGGSETNRSPVEAVIACSFLGDPFFVQDGVTVSALWGWPMMGMMRETAVRYSGQIVDVLLEQEKLIDGLAVLTSGVQRALVCGPFKTL